MRRQLLIGCWGSLVAAGMLMAQEPADPSSRVARLNYMDGPVSFRQGSIAEWAPATLNYPLTTGDHLWVDRDARAELHIGATAIHLAPRTAFAILELDDHVTQMTVAEGTLYLRVPRMDGDEIIEIDTPNGSASVQKPGDYRVDVDVSHNATSITVRSGQAQASGNGRSFTVRPGRMMQLVAAADVADFQQAPAPDPWEDWCVGRDLLAERSMEISDNYLAPETIGAEDLGEYGVWSVDASYGPVWTPGNLPTGWAPYRCGHWAYIQPWGWTWIDDAAWGFAPFHYGRWVLTATGWVWSPGIRNIRPVYLPAIVAFVSGGGLSASIAGRAGRITAWIPLGPGEAFRPNYRASEAYLRRVNDGSKTVTSYVNREGMTVVPLPIFVGASPVAAAALRIPAGAASAVKAVTEVDGVPTRESYAGRRSEAGIRTPVPPPQVADRAVFVKHELPPDIRAAVPIRGAQSNEAATTAATTPDPAAQSVSTPPAQSPRREDALSPSAPVYVVPSTSLAPGERPQHRPEPRSEPSTYTPPATQSQGEARSAPAPQRHEESRPAPPPAQRHEDSHPAPSYTPPQHQESHSAPAPSYTPPAAQHQESQHQESRPAPSSPRSDDSKSAPSSKADGASPKK
jgi:Family of unknown function (DUF6600)